MSDEPVIIAQIGRPFGIAGWVYLQSFTDPVEALFDYEPWLLQMPKKADWRPVEIEKWRSQQTGVVVKFKGCDDRTTAQSFTGARMGVLRENLPELDEETSYYWQDLEGLNVETVDGQVLGVVGYLFNQGASDVMVIEQNGQSYHIPFVLGDVVQKVELDAKRIIVDWDLTLNQVASGADDADR